MFAWRRDLSHLMFLFEANFKRTRNINDKHRVN